MSDRDLEITAYCNGLEDLARFMREHPECVPGELVGGVSVTLYAYDSEELAHLVRVAGGGAKFNNSYYVGVVRDFGPHQLRVLAPHDTVCTKRVVGTRTVTKRVASFVTKEVEEEVVEWDCPPMLSVP